MRHSTQYLYDCNPEDFSSLNYVNAINYKLDRARALIHDLVYTPYQDRDNNRVNHVFKAIKFNESLLHELKELK